jgi:hypothetical protein
VLAKLQSLLISVLDVSSQLLYRSKCRRKSHIYALGVLLGELQSRSEHGGEEKNSCPWQELNSSHEPEVTALTAITQLIIDLNLSPT